MKSYEQRSKELHHEFLEDETEYCCYCGTHYITFQCCNESHFESYATMSKESQQEFLDECMSYDDDWDGVWVNMKL